MADPRLGGKRSGGRWALIGGAVVAMTAAASLIPMTLDDFHVFGTQVGDVSTGSIWHSGECMGCHSDYDAVNEPYATWKGSLMGQAGRDPLFFAQMTTANQDVANVGYLCMRCHVPMSVVTGHANDADGSTLDYLDADGVSCHFCHSMVDPIYKPGVSPPQDEAILAALEDVPEFYANAMFVLDPTGTRRGPYDDALPMHQMIYSPFHTTGDFCGTCHDVGNVAVSRQPDGTYRYNAIDTPAPDQDPWAQFPLERTYTEWKLSAFAAGGVDMGGRFGGDNLPVVSTCQDCHMPQTTAKGCWFSEERPDIKRHEFAGASSWVLEIIAEHYAEDDDVDPAQMAAGIAAAKSMLARAATLETAQEGGALRVRVINESGHKIPTGHIEGRRIFVTVEFFDGEGALLRDYGRYDPDSAHLDEHNTEVYEMHVGLSEHASSATGFPAGVTTHMALADTIEKDNRIPPRGFNNAAYEAGGAPVVGTEYADGQHWDDSWFAIPIGAATAEVSLRYQTVTRHYIEALRDANVTDEWGDVLYDLWLRTNKGAPVLMAETGRGVGPFVRGDLTGDGLVNGHDLSALLDAWGAVDSPADLSGDRRVSGADLAVLLGSWTH